MKLDWIQRYGGGEVESTSNVDGRFTDQRRLEEACQEFEAIFLHEILKGLRRTIPEGESRQEAIYRSFLDQQIALACAKRGLGLADLLLSKLSRGEGAVERPRSPVAQPKDFPEQADN